MVKPLPSRAVNRARRMARLRKHEAAKQSASWFRWRVAAFLALSLAVIATGVWLAWPKSPAGPNLYADRTLTVTMAGYQPRNLSVPAGQPLAVKLINPDSPYHTDGGGRHQFAIPEIGLDVTVEPRGQTVFQLPALQPGTYTFVCDICCGGKENPSMQGKLTVS